MLNRFFALDAHGTTVRTGLLAGALRLVCGQASTRDWLVYVWAALGVVRFIYLA